MKRKSIIITIIFLFVVALFAVFFAFKNYNKEENKTVNIVFTTDVNYKDYLRVALRSAIENKKEDSIYNINILCVDLSEQDCNVYKKFNAKNVKINPMPVKLEFLKGIGEFEIEKKNITRADLFKFFMPQLFPDLDKILYIDIDVVIKGDLRELYNIDLKNKYLGAVNKCIPFEYVKEWCNGRITRLVRYYRYNCGVMLYNLKQWRKDNIPLQLVVAKNEDNDRELMTQNVFNQVMGQSKIVQLSPIYNTFINWDESMFNYCQFRKAFWKFSWNIKNSGELFKKSVIIHYLGENKPWDYKENQYSDLWWNYAKKEGFKYEEKNN